MNLQHALRRAALTSKLPSFLETSFAVLLTVALATTPSEDQYPVIIFSGLSKMLKGMAGNESAEHVVDLLYSWATEMSSKNKYAHVVFVSDDVFSATSLRKRTTAFFSLPPPLASLLFPLLCFNADNNLCRCGASRRPHGLLHGR